MDRELTPEEIELLLPAYALDAVDDDERAVIDAHLEGDAEARAELASLQRTASMLGHAGGPAPAAVWEKLELAIADGPARVPRPSPPVPIARAGARRRRHIGWIAAAAAAVVALVVAGGVVLVDDGGRDGPSSPEVALAQAARDANNAPGARHAVLHDADGATLATAVVLPDGTGYLTSTKMPKLTAAQTYQLWGLTKQHTISLGVMGNNPRVVAFTVAGRPLGLAITTEIAGGVAVSTQTPAAVGDFA
jgi:anti-sigma factor RsiW